MTEKKPKPRNKHKNANNRIRQKTPKKPEEKKEKHVNIPRFVQNQTA